MSTNKRITLKGEAAIDRWKQGREAWNQWVKEHPEADVDFRDVNFGPYRNDPDCHIPAHEWPFAEFHFPKGTVDFWGAQFGDGAVSFFDARFGDGAVSFFDAQFGDGAVDFQLAQFGDGKVSFRDARFGKGKVDFRSAQFGEGEVDFNGAQFGDGGVDFRYARFGDGAVNFGNTQFGDGNVSFASTRIQGDFTLSHATLGKGAYDFERSDFERRAFFDGLQGTEHVTSFSFRHASFNKPLVLSTVNNKPFGCVVDLTDTQINSHVSLQDLTLQPKETTQKDIGRFCRLKELAEGQKDLESALEFKAQEIKTVSNLSPNPLVWLLTFSFWLLSNFGRSVSLPCLSLGSVWLGFALWYAELAPRIKFGIEPLIPSWNAFKDSGALTFSASQMLGLLPSSRKADKTAQEQLFGDCTGCLPEGLYAITAFQSILSLMLLFLLGLALRNRFRL